MNRAFNWPQIKPDDAKALHSYSLFLTGCDNAMQDLNQLQEMENPTNLRIIISKLPYKMREMWRVSAFDIQETSVRKARFSDLRFINRRKGIMKHLRQVRETPQKALQLMKQHTSEVELVKPLGPEKTVVSQQLCLYVSSQRKAAR